MNTNALIPQQRAERAGSVVPPVDWRQALDTFLNTLSSPRTTKAYQRAVTEAMDAIGTDYGADITAAMLAEYRGWLVGRLDTERDDRLSPATVNLKLAGLRQFLRFCLVTGITRLSKDAIGASPVVVQKLLGHASLASTTRITLTTWNIKTWRSGHFRPSSEF